MKTIPLKELMYSVKVLEAISQRLKEDGIVRIIDDEQDVEIEISDLSAVIAAANQFPKVLEAFEFIVKHGEQQCLVLCKDWIGYGKHHPTECPQEYIQAAKEALAQSQTIEIE